MNDLKFKQIVNGGKSVEIVGRTIDKLVDNVIIYRQRKGIRPNDYSSVYNSVKKQLQVTQSEAVKKKENKSMLEKLGVRKPSRRKISFYEAFKGARALVDLARGNLVKQSELDRRAEICFACPRLNETSDCMACGAASKITREIQKIQSETNTAFRTPTGLRPGRKSPDSLGRLFCDVCGCSCLTLCLSKMKHIRGESEEKNSQRPDNCWMKREGKNFIDDESK